MTVLQPDEEPLWHPKVQSFCRLLGIAMAIIDHPSTKHCIEGAELEERLIFIPRSPGHLLDFGFEAFLCFASRRDEHLWSVVSAHIASNVIAQKVKAIVHVGNVRLFN